MRASKTQNNEANLKKGQYFQFIVSKLSKLKPLSNVDAKENLARLSLIRKGKNNGIKKIKPITALKDKEEPFKIPKNWMWLTIKDVIKLTENFNIQSKLNPEAFVSYVDISCIDNDEFKIKEVKNSSVHELSSRARRVLKKDFFLYSLVRPYLNNMAVVDDEKEMMIASTGFSVFDSFYLENDFLKYWFLSPFIKDYYNEMISGFNSPSISMNQFLDTPVPVAPIEEQKAITSFFRSLESNENKKSNSLPKDLISGIIELDSLQKYSTSLFENIEKRKLLIPQLKQSILQEAIQGKLTADWRKQNPTTEPASELLKRIKAEKAKLIKEKKIKKEKPLPPITKEEIPFELPEGWVWTKLDEIALFKNGKAHEQFVDPNGKYVLINSRFVSTNGKTAKHTGKQIMPMYKNEVAIVMSDVPNGRALSRCFMIDSDNKYSLNQRIGGIVSITGLYHEFLIKVLDRNRYYLSFNDGKKQTNLKKIQIMSCPVPIPPLSEQKEIVKKVEALMQHCQDLEQEIQTSEANAQMLMQAVLKEAFDSETKKENVWQD